MKIFSLDDEENNDSREEPQPEGWLARSSDLVPQMDLPPASVSSPDFDADRARKIIATVRRVLVILAVMAVVSLLVYALVGPGRTWLSSALTALSSLTAATPAGPPPPTVTPTVTATATRTPLPTTTHTPLPTLTPVSGFPELITTTVSMTPTITLTPTPSDCTPALAVTLDDLGKTLCVTGTVLEVITQDNATLIIFSDERGKFYFVSYDIEWPLAVPGACVRATGEIKQLLSNPVMVLSYKTPLEACP